MSVEHSDTIRIVAKDDKVFPEDADGERQVRDIRRQCHRVPVSAHQFSARSLRPYMGQFGVLCGNISPVVTRIRSLNRLELFL